MDGLRGKRLRIGEPTGDERRDIVARVRERHQLSQEDLANRLNVTAQTVRNWERGRCFVTGPAFKMLEKMLEKERS